MNRIRKLPWESHFFLQTCLLRDNRARQIDAGHQDFGYLKKYLLKSAGIWIFIKVCLPLFIVCFIMLGFSFIEISGAEERSAAKTSHSQIQQIEKDLLEQQEALLSINSKEKGILEELERLQREVVVNRRSLKELSSQIKEISYEIERGKKRVQSLNDSSCAVRDYLIKRLVAFYKFGRSGYIWLLTSSTNLQEFQKTIKYMKTILAEDSRALNILDNQKRQIENELYGLKQNVAKMQELKKVENSKMAQLETYIEKKVLLLMKIHQEKEFHAKAVKELENATRNLHETMIHLKTKQKQDPVPQQFAQMKGKLPLPVNGKILGDAKQSGFNPFRHRKGIYIKGSPGEAVRSVFPGRVDYSGWFKGYGQLLIVDHGHRYFTVFAHLEERIKEKGESVSEGEIVGLLGDPGWQVGPGVYFEIRKGGDHLDPQKWLKKE